MPTVGDGSGSRVHQGQTGRRGYTCTSIQPQWRAGDTGLWAGSGGTLTWCWYSFYSCHPPAPGLPHTAMLCIFTSRRISEVREKFEISIQTDLWSRVLEKPSIAQLLPLPYSHRPITVSIMMQINPDHSLSSCYTKSFTPTFNCRSDKYSYICGYISKFGWVSTYMNIPYSGDGYYHIVSNCIHR